MMIVKRLYVVLMVMLPSVNISAAISLSSAIEHVAKVHGVTISYSPTLTDTISVQSMPKGVSVDDDLSALLESTDLNYKKANDEFYYLGKDKSKIRMRKAREAEERERMARARIEEFQRQKAISQRIIPKPGQMLFPRNEFAGDMEIKANVPVIVEHEEPSRPHFALKTNALLLATTSPNLAFEVAVGDRFSVELPVSVNFWLLGNASLQHVALFPALKYWLGNEPFSSDYVGVYVGYVNYDFGNIDMFGDNIGRYWYDGNLYSAGVLYGNRFNLSRHFALEAEIGMGYVYLKHDYSNTNGFKHKFSLTRLALNACYTF